MTLLRAVVVLMCVSLSSPVKILTYPALNCSQQGLTCKVSTSNCLDSSWLDVNQYTPSSPEGLQVSVDTRQDEKGDLQPVLRANWNLRDDGSIRDVTATELHLLVIATNQNLCVRYSFKEKLEDMRSPSREKWSFSANMLVLDPGQMYRVSVFNIPKPELTNTHYDVSTKFLVPDCQDPKMKMTQFCIERGSLWQPNISVISGRSALTVSFTPDSLCDEYYVIVRCADTQHAPSTLKADQTTPNVSFSLDNWPRSCCQFDAEIKPVFPQCGQDCVRRRTTLNICPDMLAVKPTDAPDTPVYTFVGLGLVFLCVLMAFIMFILCRKPRKPRITASPVGVEKPRQQPLKQPPKVLVIYSQDHHLYRDVVLKLCAFLQARCGTKVLVDLLDSTSVGMVGPFRWLEWQRQQLQNPSDKILVLCSQGVQAKWRAMCGQGQVKLREDVLSPNDDMLTPFLSLFLSDMYKIGMRGKYMVAYFDDISREKDVPSVFDLGVKYKLMKHFEELFFRILDIEKYQPGQVNHIKGIGVDEYFECPSGRALRNAIETFQAYQLENPDWFEKQCVESEEEVRTEADQLIDELQIPPVLECVPLIREGPPVYTREIEINENDESIHVLIPEVNLECQLSSVAQLTPVLNSHQYPSNLDEVLTDHLYPRSPIPSVYIVEPDLNKPHPARQNWVSLEDEPLGQTPTEDEEEDSLLPMSQPSAHTAHQNSLETQDSSCASVQSEYFTSGTGHSQPVAMEEDEVLVPSGKAPSSGSDQGYISKMSSQNEAPFKEDPLEALRRLQEAQFQDMGLEGF